MSRIVELDALRKKKRRCASITFHAAAFIDADGKWVSPAVKLQFTEPVSVQRASERLNEVIDLGIIVAEDGYHIPWPCASVHFEWVD